MGNQVIDWQRTINDSMVAFEEIARHTQLVKWETESRFALQAVQRNSKLRECIPSTVQDAIINVAAVGLTLNPADGYAYLVPEYNKQLEGNECQLRISFKGFIKVATDDGPIRMVKAEIVKRNDHFTYRGPFSEPTHECEPFGDRGESIGVYCVAYLHTGECICDFMNWAEVQKCRKAAKFDSVWSEWEDEMAKKSMVKRAAKQWPRGKNDTRLNKTIQVMNEVEGLGDDWEIIEEAAEQIIEAIESDDATQVDLLWDELTDKQKEMIWMAKTKGGYFTQAQKTYIRQTHYKIVNPDVVAELKAKIDESGLDWDFIHNLLDNFFNEDGKERTTFDLDSLPVGYARWVIGELQKREEVA